MTKILIDQNFPDNTMRHEDIFNLIEKLGHEPVLFNIPSEGLAKSPSPPRSTLLIIEWSAWKAQFSHVFASSSANPSTSTEKSFLNNLSWLFLVRNEDKEDFFQHETVKNVTYLIYPASPLALRKSLLLAIDRLHSETPYSDTSHSLNKEMALCATNEITQGMSHDINNPLTVVVGTVQQIKKLLSQGQIDPVKMDSLLDRMERNGHRITNLVKGLAVLNRDFTNEEVRKTSAEKLFANITPFVTEHLHKAGLTLQAEIEDPEATILCRPSLFSQAMLCLLHLVRDSFTHTDTERKVQIHCSSQQEIFQIKISASSADTRNYLSQFDRLRFPSAVVQSHNGDIQINYNEPYTELRISLPLAVT